MSHVSGPGPFPTTPLLPNSTISQHNGDLDGGDVLAVEHVQESRIGGLLLEVVVPQQSRALAVERARNPRVLVSNSLVLVSIPVSITKNSSLLPRPEKADPCKREIERQEEKGNQTYPNSHANTPLHINTALRDSRPRRRCIRKFLAVTRVL